MQIDVALNDPHREALAETLTRERSAMDVRQLAGALLCGALFWAAELVLFGAQPLQHVSPAPVLACVLVLACAVWVRLDTPLGFTVPTQLAYVPLVFAAPAAVAPLLVLAALLLEALIGVIRGRMKAARLVNVPANAAFALGPAAVFVIAGVRPQDAGPGVLLAALGAQIVVDYGVSACRGIIEREATLFSQLNETWVYAVDAGLSCVGLVVAQGIGRSPIQVLALLPLLAMLAVFARERRQRLEGIIELGNAYRGTALVLGDVVEADDGYTGEHCRSVVALAVAVATELALSPDHTRNLEFAALLHDVGKIAIPKEIINKPGKLDPGEWTIIKTHTLAGQKMLDRVGGFMRDVGMIVRSHHERWDGAGYPDGLAGTAIPLEARIVSCCDMWNAMRTDRVYRRALTYEVAEAELLAAAGSQLDPTIVPALLSVVARDEPAGGSFVAVAAPAPAAWAPQAAARA